MSFTTLYSLHINVYKQASSGKKLIKLKARKQEVIFIVKIERKHKENGDFLWDYFINITWRKQYNKKNGVTGEKYLITISAGSDSNRKLISNLELSTLPNFTPEQVWNVK